MTDILKRIAKINKEHEIVLYMKGSKDFPQCGFSAMTSQILKNLDLDFFDVDVLQDMELRQGIKDFSDWPTIPQLYIKEEFVGGCDIVKEMLESGELLQLLQNKGLK